MLLAANGDVARIRPCIPSIIRPIRNALSKYDTEILMAVLKVSATLCTVFLVFILLLVIYLLILLTIGIDIYVYIFAHVYLYENINFVAASRRYNN